MKVRELPRRVLANEPRFLRRLLVATDGSTGGDRAVGYAIAIAIRDGSTIVVCHAAARLSALGESLAAGDTPPYVVEAVQRMRGAGISVTAEELDGSPTDAIVARVEHDTFDALIMGTRTERGFARAIDGSVASSVLRRIGVPVFMIPESVPPSMPAFSRILVGVDDAGSSGAALTFATNLARSDGAHLIVCNVLGVDGATAIESDEHVGSKSVAFESIVARGEPATEIVRAADEHGADCIVVGTHGRTGVHRLVQGSVAEAVVRSSDVPIAVVRSFTVARS